MDIGAIFSKLRSRYFWLVLASFLFVIAMTFLPSVPMRQGDRDDPNDDAPVEHVSPFFAGFIAACALGGFWTFDYRRQHPKRSPNLRGPVMDYYSGQRFFPDFYVAEGEKWAWMACIRETESGEMHAFELEPVIHENDLGYGDDIHILPRRFNESDSLEGHDLARSCCCIPVIMEQVRGRTLVIHLEKDHRSSPASEFDKSS